MNEEKGYQLPDLMRPCTARSLLTFKILGTTRTKERTAGRKKWDLEGRERENKGNKRTSHSLFSTEGEEKAPRPNESISGDIGMSPKNT